jgi:hypothetical protein
MIDFLIELVLRLFSKTPNFFKIVRTISIILTVITGLPLFLQESGIDLPSAWDAIASKIVSIAGVVSAFIASLAVEDPKNLKP